MRISENSEPNLKADGEIKDPKKNSKTQRKVLLEEEDQENNGREEIN